MSQKRIKQGIKDFLSAVAPKAASNWQEVRRRRHILQFEQRMGSPALTVEFIAEHGQTVLEGPFTGMKYITQAAGSALMPKLLGCYEAELHDVIALVIATDYDAVIDIGCAEGYYANGLAMRLPSTQIYAFDTDLRAQTLCKEMAQLNGVGKQVTVFGECQHHNLIELMTGRLLIVCDCEGYEIILLQPTRVPALVQADILVELHDQERPGLTSLLLARFQATHSVTLITSVERDAVIYSSLKFSEPEKRRLAVSEFRSPGQQWAFLKANTPASKLTV